MLQAVKTPGSQSHTAVDRGPAVEIASAWQMFALKYSLQPGLQVSWTPLRELWNLGLFLCVTSDASRLVAGKMQCSEILSGLHAIAMAGLKHAYCLLSVPCNQEGAGFS